MNWAAILSRTKTGQRLHQLKAAFLLFSSPAGWSAPSQLDVVGWGEPGLWWRHAGPGQPGEGRHLEVPVGFVASENTGTTYSRENPSTTSDLQIKWIQINIWTELHCSYYFSSSWPCSWCPTALLIFPFSLLLLTCSLLLEPGGTKAPMCSLASYWSSTQVHVVYLGPA